MKSLRQLSTTLGLLGTVVAGNVIGGSLPAQALPDDQVIQRLQSVPVFTITDSQGAPLVASVPVGNNQNGANAQRNASVAGVFISRTDAARFIEQLKTQNPQLASTVQVVPVPLSAVYKLEQANRNKPGAIEFTFVPTQSQVDIAKQLLTQQGKPAGEFDGVPLFVARGGQDKGYLTVQQNGKPVIPFFFKKEQLQELLDRFKQQQPGLASSVEIQVVNLEGMIETLRTSNNQQLNSVVLVPPQETIDFLRSQGGNQPAPASNSATPAAPRR